MAEASSPSGTPPETGDITEQAAAVTAPQQARTDRSPWNWLLLVPIVVPLVTALFNHEEPRLFGFPTFYWLQLAFIILGVGTTSLVYRMSGRR